MINPETSINSVEVIELEPQDSLWGNLDRATIEALNFAEQCGIGSTEISLLCDLDGVMRRTGREKPGAVPDQSVKALHGMEKAGITIAGFITNQPLDGQQFAKISGKVFGYEPMKLTLQREFPTAEVLSAQKRIDFMIHKAKNDPEIITAAREIIDNLPEDQKLIVMFGDKDSDLRFFERVLQQSTTPRYFLFVKFPGMFDNVPFGDKIEKITP